ncbi:MAG TPA: hypothetical protein VFR34_06055, partial [Paracoccaceae bacterium]|nr:hypothetical protein [Paracoccaceae bacterium]
DTAEEAIIDEAAMTAMEEAALDTLDPDLGRAAFDDAVGALAPPSGPPGPALRGSLWRAAADGGVLQLRHPAMPPVSYFATFLDLTTARWAMVQA